MPSALISREENKVEFLETQLRSEKFWFVHKKESEHSFELSISICFFYQRVSILKTTTWWTRASHFVDGWHLLRCQICFFPNPYVVDHETFVGEGGYGWFTLGKNFFQNPLEFSLTYNGVRFLSSIICFMSDIFFQCRILFFPSISWQAFPPRNQSAGYPILFSEITHNLLKSQIVGW